MLARRFTIVCLLMALFGMFFSILVAQTGRKAHSWKDAVVISSATQNGNASASQAG